MTVVGIDLGTTNSLIALWRNGKSEIVPNPLGHALTPSVVNIDADGTVLVGEAARERLQSHPERSVAAFKRAMGSNHHFRIADRAFRAEELAVNVFQGEARRVADNIALGGFELTLPSGKCSEVSADVRFTYDVNGLLEVEATPMRHGVNTGEPCRLVIRHAQERRTPGQIAVRLAELSALKIHPRDRQEARTLLARAERLHGQTLGAVREDIAQVVTAYEFALEGQEESVIAQARSQLQACLSAVESHLHLGLADPS